MSLKDILNIPNGANFVKVDLHLHTPADISFSADCPLNNEGERKEFAKKYCTELRRKGIKVGAITDHNQIDREWFNLISEEAKGVSVTIFPGVEISVNEGKRAIHLIALFDISENIAGINDTITAIFGGKDRFDDQGLPRSSELSFEETVNRLKENHSCICIAAHPNNSKGLFKELSQSKVAELIKRVPISAFDHLDKKTLKSFIRSQENILQGTKIPSIIESSDAKRIEEIGERFTYIKLSSFLLEALRQAFIDPESRIRLPHELEKEEYTRVIGFETVGANFLSNTKIHFNYNSQCLIGGRGTGKSAILETLRYVMDIQPPQTEKEVRYNLVRHSLGSGGKGIVYIRHKYNKIYKIERILGEEPRIYELVSELRDKKSTKEEWNELTISSRDIFLPDPFPEMFGQKEIYEVSQNEEYQLKVIDGTIGKELEEIKRQRDEAIEKINDNARMIISTGEKLIKKEDYEKELGGVKQELKLYKEQKVTEKLGKESKLNREKLKLSKIGETFKTLHDQILLMHNDISETFESAIAMASGEINSELFEELRNKLIEYRDKSMESSLQLKDVMLKIIDFQGKVLKKWEKRQEEFQEELAIIKRTLRTDKLDPDRFLQLDKRKNILAPLIDELNRATEKIKELRSKRARLLKKLEDINYREHLIRKKKTEEINDKLQEALNITPEYKGFKEKFYKYLVSIFKGSKIRTDYFKNICDNGDAISFAKTVREGKQALKQKYSFTDTAATQIVEWLEEDKLMEIETLHIPDRINIRLKVGKEYKQFSDLSLGQKCTSLLLLLLLEKDVPLIIDQPEDDLDNRFVYEDVVRILRKEKIRRQFIIATHNANIPVLGDAELIAVLETERDKGKIKARGSIDDSDICEGIKEILEGGETAFIRRREKYGI